jgi:phage replication initiation protein
MAKLKHPPKTPAQIEAVGRLSDDELARMAALCIRDELLAADRRVAAARSGAAPAGFCPPPNNMGGKYSVEHEIVDLVLDNGQIKQVSKRRGWGGDSAFIDWVNFTVGEEITWNSFGESNLLQLWKDHNFKEFNKRIGEVSPITPYEVMVVMSEILVDIFGFGITAQRSTGANFYKTSFALGPVQKSGSGEYGMVCYGGQNHTILVMLSGVGCAAAKPGWELRLKDFLEAADRAKITRLDLAHDDYHGTTYTVDKADQDHTLGLFNCGGRNPVCEHRGDWKSPNGSGRTFNIGNRKNGKYCRIYEKGRQLGMSDSEWTRIEVEFKSVDRVIPFDALIRSGEYLAASYPAFVWISETQERIYTTQKVVEANVDKAVNWIRHQCGASIGVMVELFGVDSFLSKVVREGTPAWSKVPNFNFSPEPIGKKLDSCLSLESAAFLVDF